MNKVIAISKEMDKIHDCLGGFSSGKYWNCKCSILHEFLNFYECYSDYLFSLENDLVEKVSDLDKLKKQYKKFNVDDYKLIPKILRNILDKE